MTEPRLFWVLAPFDRSQDRAAPFEIESSPFRAVVEKVEKFLQLTKTDAILGGRTKRSRSMNTLFVFALGLAAVLGILWLAGSLLLRKLAPPHSH